MDGSTSTRRLRGSFGGWPRPSVAWSSHALGRKPWSASQEGVPENYTLDALFKRRMIMAKEICQDNDFSTKFDVGIFLTSECGWKSPGHWGQCHRGRRNIRGVPREGEVRGVRGIDRWNPPRHRHQGRGVIRAREHRDPRSAANGEMTTAQRAVPRTAR